MPRARSRPPIEPPALPPWAAYGVAFLASGCSLVLEIVAGRVLAPFVGVSLYTWTSIIGVVLAGLAIGNLLGGAAGDRWPTHRTLAIALVGGGVATLAAPLLAPLVGQPPLVAMPAIWRILLGAAAGFFLPSALLGGVTPIIVRLLLRDLDHAGNLVGRLYACATVGSILATFVTGFVLIAWFGTRSIILGVGVTLLALALLVFWLGRAHAPRGARLGSGGSLGLVALLAGTLLAGWPPSLRAALDSGCDRESSYYCIRVIPGREREDAGARQVETLLLDHMAHSIVDPRDPTYLRYSYVRILAAMVDYAAGAHPAPRVLFLGGGGYSVPRYLLARYPGARADVVEIDPVVTEVAQESLGLRPDTRLGIYSLDGRVALDALAARGPYDIVIGDAFNDLSVPYHLTTVEFDARVCALLAPDGLYAVHVIDRLHSGNFLRSYAHSLQAVFPAIALFGNVTRWDADAKESWVVVATARPLDPARLAQLDGPALDGRLATSLMPALDLERWRAEQPPLLLTDDYAPDDTLLAPLFFERVGS